jgi:hypothetical protein
MLQLPLGRPSKASSTEFVAIQKIFRETCKRFSKNLGMSTADTTASTFGSIISKVPNAFGDGSVGYAYYSRASVVHHTCMLQFKHAGDLNQKALLIIKPHYHPTH